MFDVQQYRKHLPIFPASNARERLIKTISSLISIVEDLDELAIMAEEIDVSPPYGCVCRENDGRNGAPLCPVHEID